MKLQTPESLVTEYIHKRRSTSGVSCMASSIREAQNAEAEESSPYARQTRTSCRFARIGEVIKSTIGGCQQQTSDKE